MKQFGWIPTEPEKRRDQILRYPVRAAQLSEPPSVMEKTLPVSWNYRLEYDQGDTAECVGYSGAYKQSTNANIHGYRRLYDAHWLYVQACELGGTTDGAYLWAAADVMRKSGMIRIEDGVKSLVDGIASYVWAENTRDIRAAIWNDQPVWIGMPWYEKFMQPRTISGDYWIATESSWGALLGGHAIMGFAWSDLKKAVALTNTWGDDYPAVVWMPWFVLEKWLMNNQEAECCLTLDRFVDPLPVPVPADEIELSLYVSGKRYFGKLQAAK